MTCHICGDDHDQRVTVDRELLEALLEALRPIGAAYPDDPGTSDLYDEQPVTITLGDVRRAWRAIRKAEA